MGMKDVVRFSVAAGFASLFFDAALTHGLFWAEDPLWTYWAFNFCLLTGVFLLGTAQLGFGLRQGVVLSAAHALLLTLYHHWLAPIGLPQEPEWIGPERLWLTGPPMRFLATLAGYLLVLWLRRCNRARRVEASFEGSTGVLAVRSLLSAFLIVLLDVSLGYILFRRPFADFTLLIQHLAIAFVFLCAWTPYAAASRIGWLVGALLLALIWTTFDLYLGVEGLPSGSPEYADHALLWRRGFPVAAVSALLGFGATGRFVGAPRAVALGLLAGAAIIVATWQESALAQGFFLPRAWTEGLHASAKTSGDGFLVVGPDPSDAQNRYPIAGRVEIEVIESGARHAGPHGGDVVDVRARFVSAEDLYEVTIRKTMPRHPLGQHTTWSGVAYNREMHGDSGIGDTALPRVRPEIALWGWAVVKRNGELIARMASAHVMAARSGLLPGVLLRVDTEGRGLLTEPDGHLTAYWPEIGVIRLPDEQIRARSLAACAALFGIVATLGVLATFDHRRRPAPPRFATPERPPLPGMPPERRGMRRLWDALAKFLFR